MKRNLHKEENLFKEVRQFLGISQALMATFYKVTSSLYSMAEGDFRLLDPHKMLKLVELNKIKNSPEAILPETAEALSLQHAKAIDWAKNQIRECEIRIFKLEEQLLLLQLEQTRCLAVLNRMTSLRTFFTENSDSSLYDIIHWESKDKQQESSLPVVLALELKLTAARAEQAFLENTLNNLESNALNEPRI